MQGTCIVSNTSCAQFLEIQKDLKELPYFPLFSPKHNQVEQISLDLDLFRHLIWQSLVLFPLAVLLYIYFANLSTV